jgi:hypothetical protein
VRDHGSTLLSRADLKCPQTDEAGSGYWSYSLVHGPSGRSSSTTRPRTSPCGRPSRGSSRGTADHSGTARNSAARQNMRGKAIGWRLPSLLYLPAKSPSRSPSSMKPSSRNGFALGSQGGDDGRWSLYRPTQVPHGSQGYLTKMPSEWVARWPELTDSQSSSSGHATSSHHWPWRLPPRFGRRPCPRSRPRARRLHRDCSGTAPSEDTPPRASRSRGSRASLGQWATVSNLIRSTCS